MSRLILALILAFAAAGPVAAQKYQPKAIQFKGAPDYADSELLAASGMAQGGAYTMQEIRDHAQKLMDTGMFDNIAFKANGPFLVFELTPTTVLYSVRLENLPLVAGPDLDSKLHDRVPMYHGKVPGEGGLLNDVTQALEAVLAAEGVTAALVTAPYASEIGQAKATAISFSIASPKVRVGAIQMQGASSDMQGQLKGVLTRASGKDFDTGNSAHALESAISDFYEDRGYAAAKVHVALSGNPEVGSDAILVPLLVSVEEGRTYKMVAIHLPPETPVSQSEMSQLRSSGGGEGSLRVHSLLSLILRKCKSAGHMDCTVAAHPQLDETAGTVAYNVEMNPGPVYRMGFVKFDNVNDTLRGLLMKNWQLLPGQPFDESYVSAFLTKAGGSDPLLRQALGGAMANIEILPDPQTHDVNLVIHLEKR
jgi:outer membrane protein assembly factor BamA